MSTQFTSIGGAASKALREHLLEQEIRRRQSMQDSLLQNDRMRQQARQDMLDARQVEQDRLATERYNTERQDGLMERADNQAQRYLANEREDIVRKEAAKQTSMDKADAAANRYQDSELRRQEDDKQREFQANENAAQRANSRNIAGMQMRGSGSGEGKQTK